MVACHLRVAAKEHSAYISSSVGTIDTNMKGETSTHYVMYISLSDFQKLRAGRADPSGRAAGGVGLRPLACCDCGFESRRGHERLFLVSVVCCEIFSASSWSLV